MQEYNAHHVFLITVSADVIQLPHSDSVDTEYNYRILDNMLLCFQMWKLSLTKYTMIIVNTVVLL